MINCYHFMRVPHVMRFVTISFLPAFTTPPTKGPNTAIHCTDNGMAIQLLNYDCRYSSAIRVDVRL